MRIFGSFSFLHVLVILISSVHLSCLVNSSYQIAFCTWPNWWFVVKCFFPVEGLIDCAFFFAFGIASKFLALNSLPEITLLAAIPAPWILRCAEIDSIGSGFLRDSFKKISPRPAYPASNTIILYPFWRQNLLKASLSKWAFRLLISRRIIFSASPILMKLFLGRTDFSLINSLMLARTNGASSAFIAVLLLLISYPLLNSAWWSCVSKTDWRFLKCL